MEEFKKRLLEFIEGHLCISIRAFERQCGLTNGTVGTIGGKGPGAEIVQKIAYTYPELNLNWLFVGSGNMLLSGKSDTSPSVSIGTIQTVNIGNWGELVNLLNETKK